MEQYQKENLKQFKITYTSDYIQVQLLITNRSNLWSHHLNHKYWLIKNMALLYLRVSISAIDVEKGKLFVFDT